MKTKIKWYNKDHIEVIQHKESNYTSDKKDTEDNTIHVNPNNSIKIKDISNSKARVRDYILSNDFTHFITITLNQQLIDRYTMPLIIPILKRRLKTLKSYNKDFKYIIIAEYHKKKKDNSIHFHGLVMNYPKDDIQNNKMTSFEKHMGFSTIYPIKCKNKLASYMNKYFTKDMIKMQGTYYIASRGLNKPQIIDIQNVDFKEWDYIHKYRDYKVKKITKNEFDLLQVYQKLI